MGVIVIDEDSAGWGASSLLIRSMADYFIRTVGEKRYLIDLRNAFDWGYNTFDLSELNESDLDEMAMLVQMFIDSGEFRVSPYPPEEVEASLADLVRRMHGAQQKRHAK